MSEAKLSGYTVSFDELEHGSLLELEKGQLTARMTKTESPNLNAVQRHEFLTGQKAPAALVAAFQRATNGAVDVAPTTATMDTEAEGETRGGR